MAYSKFTNRRGRPRTPEKPAADYGTPELIFKRAHGHTAESVDLCLERGIIGASQHRAGLHLRWLYTLRFGAPSVAAMDLLRAGGTYSPEDGASDWRIAREADYEQAARLLAARGDYEMVLGVCVFDKRPAFLYPAKWERAYCDAALRCAMEAQMHRLKDGLDALSALWRKPAKSAKNTSETHR